MAVVNGWIRMRRRKKGIGAGQQGERDLYDSVDDISI